MTTQTKITCTECNTDFTSNQSFTKHITRYHPKHVHTLQATSTTTPTPVTPAVQAPAAPADPLPTDAAASDTPAEPTTAAPAPHIDPLQDNDDEELATDSASNEEELVIDDDVMKEFENEMELYEQIEELSQAEIEAGKEDEMKAKIAEKLSRFKNIVQQKSKLVKMLQEKDTESQRQISMMREVEEDQAKAITAMKTESKKMENSTTQKENTIKNIETELAALREKNGALIKEKTNLKIEVKEKDDYIKSLEEEIKDADDEEDDADKEQGTSGLNMNKDTPLCIICEQEFLTNQDLENHMSDKHNDIECNLCGKGFTNKKNLRNHIDKCSEKNVTIVQCPSCKKNFAQGALKKHVAKGKCKQNTVKFVCTDCNLVANSEDEIQNHKRKDHSKADTRSREVCRHYRQGNCRKGETCPFAHVGAQDFIRDVTNTTQST